MIRCEHQKYDSLWDIMLTFPDVENGSNARIEMIVCDNCLTKIWKPSGYLYSYQLIQSKDVPYEDTKQTIALG